MGQSLNSSQNLQQIITQRIQQSERQRITFADFMETVLYQPEFGYYSTPGSIIGPKGDFITSPHMGHDFGEMIAEQFADMWQALGQPNPFTLVEMGAGQGLVAADVLTYLQKHYFDCFACLNYVVVEKSVALKAEQKKRLSRWQDQGVQISWQELTDIPTQSIVGCAFSNELVDAFPVHWVELHSHRLQEMWVSVGQKGFVPVLGRVSTPQLQKYFERIGIGLSKYPDGYRSEVNLAALDWLSAVSARMNRGYVLTIDYGYTAQRYYSLARNQGTLQCYYQHAHHSDPFVHVGEQDITAHVDFTALENKGREVELEKIGFVQQGLFLMALGLGDRLSKLSNPVMSDREATAPATGRAIQDMMMRREALQQLISPMGLGNFGVLIQGKGLTPKEIARPLKGLTIPPMM